MGGTPLYAIAITCLLVLVLLGLIRSPKRFACFYFLFRPLVQPFAYNQYRLIGTLPLTGIFPVLLIVYVFFLTLFSRTRTFLPRNSVYLYLMLFFFVGSSFFSIDYFATIAWSLKFLTGVMMFILMYNNIKNEQDFMFFIKALLYCSIVPMAFGYYQYIAGTGSAWKGEFYAGKRIDSFLGEYNAYGEFLCLIICSTIIWLARETGKVKRAFVVLAFLSLIISLVLSLNRGSWIALTFGLIIASLRFHRRINLKWLIIGFTAIFLVFGTVMAERFQELEIKTEYGSKNTFEGRAMYWKKIFGLVLERPILGYGAGTAPIVLQRQLKAVSPPHNDYLLLWFECGFFTVLTYILFLAANALFFLTRRNNLIIINYGLSAACCYFMVISVVQNIIMNVTVFPMFLGLVGAGLKLNALAGATSHAKVELTPAGQLGTGN
ncbi:MAG: O-antigen ligase family protein [Desulfobulbaceae bacterium]|nr:O-antigen ligase family protein [Desulfobulbaceae bacterium]